MEKTSTRSSIDNGIEQHNSITTQKSLNWIRQTSGRTLRKGEPARNHRNQRRRSKIDGKGHSVVRKLGHTTNRSSSSSNRRQAEKHDVKFCGRGQNYHPGALLDLAVRRASPLKRSRIPAGLQRICVCIVGRTKGSNN